MDDNNNNNNDDMDIAAITESKTTSVATNRLPAYMRLARRAPQEEELQMMNEEEESEEEEEEEQDDDDESNEEVDESREGSPDEYLDTEGDEDSDEDRISKIGSEDTFYRDMGVKIEKREKRNELHRQVVDVNIQIPKYEEHEVTFVNFERNGRYGKYYAVRIIYSEYDSTHPGEQMLLPLRYAYWENKIMFEQWRKKCMICRRKFMHIPDFRLMVALQKIQEIRRELIEEYVYRHRADDISERDHRGARNEFLRVLSEERRLCHVDWDEPWMYEVDELESNIRKFLKTEERTLEWLISAIDQNSFDYDNY